MDRNEMNAIGRVLTAIETVTPAAPELPFSADTRSARRPVLALVSGFAAVLLVVGVVAVGVSLNRNDAPKVGAALIEDPSPFVLADGEAACVLTIGESVETAKREPIQRFDNSSWLLFKKQLGPLSEGGSDRRAEGYGSPEIDWDAEAKIRDGVLIVRMTQPTVGAQSESWLLADIPPEGVVMSGPYDNSDGLGNSYFLTCWTGPTG